MFWKLFAIVVLLLSFGSAGLVDDYESPLSLEEIADWYNLHGFRAVVVGNIVVVNEDQRFWFMEGIEHEVDPRRAFEVI
jgi:hypothetical protein